MEQGVATILQVVIGSGLGAGVVTFVLNFWKAERDIRRANLERLYAAVHRYTFSMSLVAAQMRIGEFNPSEELNKSFKDAEDFDLITLLIDLYFPRLKPIFESLRRKNQDFVMIRGEGGFRLRTDGERIREDFLELVAEGEKLKQAVADLARELEVFPAG
jgi:hypothetical protein